MKPVTINFTDMTDTQIRETLQLYRLSLTTEEAHTIQNNILKRPPTIAELVLWSIQGSEHCSYRSSRQFLKQFVVDSHDVILGPGEDAGIVSVAVDNYGKRYGVVMSHESHNHPSQIVPYEGAATGIGGNVRDVSCMGAKVIAVADPLRFGEISRNKTKWIHEGVVSGIAGYGNPIGVPNIAGDVYYDARYNENCLVNVVTLGVVREEDVIHSKAPIDAVGYDLILVGKPTDNSGFGGASMASVSLEKDDTTANKGAVQEPNAFLKRHLLKATYTLFDILKKQNFINRVGFKDLGAGGIACASVEIADAGGYGADIFLDAVPTSVSDLPPQVILCAETQERYLWAVHKDISPLILEHYNKTFNLPSIATGAQATIIGKITDTGLFIVSYNNESYVHARACDVTKGILYDRPYTKPDQTYTEPDISVDDSNLQIILNQPNNNPNLQVISNQPINKYPNIPSIRNSVDLESFVDSHHHFTFQDIFLQLLSHPNIADRSPIFEKYDKQVQGITVIERGDADAGVMQPFVDDTYPEEIRNTGIALSVAQNPRISTIDPYWGGAHAVVSAMRKVVAVGAIPVALTDCLNFGNPEKPEQMWEFVEAVRGVADAQKHLHLKKYPDTPTPIISGNVSFYNESGNHAIAPSPIISCLGQMNDVSKAITMHFKKTNSILLMIAKRTDTCGGSVYYQLFDTYGANVPTQHFEEIQRELFALTDAIQQELILSAHVIAEGGVAIALAQMSFQNEIGCEVNIPCTLREDKKLFGEAGGFVIEVDETNVTKLNKILQNYNIELCSIGKTTDNVKLKIEGCIDVDLMVAKERWMNGLREKL